MKKLLAIAAFAALISVSALAQTAKPSTGATNWTGFYAGLNTGGEFGFSHAQTATSEDSSLGGTYFVFDNISGVNSTGNQTLHPKGSTIGLQFGYNRQISPKWVLGLEADYGALTARNSVASTADYASGAGYTFTITQKVSTDWMSSVRARVGHAYGKRGLLFVSVGAAETALHYSSSFLDDEWNASESASTSVLKTGWTIGGGEEYAINKHWSARAEYLYTDFGKVSNAGSVLQLITYGYTYTFPGNPFTHTATLKSNVARVAVNYRF
jgi:outer membrane immunogenic protein